MQRSLEDQEWEDYGGYQGEENVSYTCPSWAPIVGFTGIACAVVFASKSVVVRRGERWMLLE